MCLSLNATKVNHLVLCWLPMALSHLGEDMTYVVLQSNEDKKEKPDSDMIKKFLSPRMSTFFTAIKICLSTSSSLHVQGIEDRGNVRPRKKSRVQIFLSHFAPSEQVKAFRWPAPWYVGLQNGWWCLLQASGELIKEPECWVLARA